MISGDDQRTYLNTGTRIAGARLRCQAVAAGMPRIPRLVLAVRATTGVMATRAVIDQRGPVVASSQPASSAP
jgi:hypothetical protein